MRGNSNSRGEVSRVAGTAANRKDALWRRAKSSASCRCARSVARPIEVSARAMMLSAPPRTWCLVGEAGRDDDVKLQRPKPSREVLVATTSGSSTIGALTAPSTCSSDRLLICSSTGGKKPGTLAEATMDQNRRIERPSSLVLRGNGNRPHVQTTVSSVSILAVAMSRRPPSRDVGQWRRQAPVWRDGRQGQTTVHRYRGRAARRSSESSGGRCLVEECHASSSSIPAQQGKRQASLVLTPVTRSSRVRLGHPATMPAPKAPLIRRRRSRARPRRSCRREPYSSPNHPGSGPLHVISGDEAEPVDAVGGGLVDIRQRRIAGQVRHSPQLVSRMAAWRTGQAGGRLLVAASSCVWARAHAPSCGVVDGVAMAGAMPTSGLAEPLHAEGIDVRVILFDEVASSDPMSNSPARDSQPYAH